MKISEIKQQYPHPNKARYIDGDYSVGGAFCFSYRNYIIDWINTHRGQFNPFWEQSALYALQGSPELQRIRVYWPDEEFLMIALMSVYPLNSAKAPQCARLIINYNNEGLFDKAWKVLEQLEEEAAHG